MFDTSIYRQGQSLESGLRAGSMMGSAVRGVMDNNAVKQAAARIQAGENQQAVISELMAQSPQAAQQLMSLIGGQMKVDAAGQELTALKQKVGTEVMQGAAMPLFMALQANDDKARSEFIKQGAAIFQGRDDTAASVLNEMAGLQGKQQFDALAGTVKALQQAGVFPQDPRQLLGQGTALGQNLALYDQAIAAGDTERAAMILRVMDPAERAQAQGAARVETEQSLNPILASREAGKATAIEGTAGGQADLAAQQAAAQKAQNEVKEEEIRKAKQIDLSKQAMVLAREIATSPQLGAVTGIAAEVPTINPQSRDLITKAQQLVAMMTAENMKLMSGVLTQADMELLQTLSTGLKVDEKGIKGSEQAVAKQLNMIADKIERTLMEKGALEKKPAQQGGAAAGKPRNYEKEYGLGGGR